MEVPTREGPILTTRRQARGNPSLAKTCKGHEGRESLVHDGVCVLCGHEVVLRVGWDKDAHLTHALD